ncbi:MAG: YtxH domain-containing protein [Ignavibacteriae bacterium]|nr:YtxH domain-containing protein [Ignavibacteriota bacterium]
MAEEQTHSNGFGKGILIGSLFGAALALLYAPKSGAELRKDVRKRADGFKTSFTRYARKMKKQTNGILSKALSDSEEAGEEGTRSHRSRTHV